MRSLACSPFPRPPELAYLRIAAIVVAVLIAAGVALFFLTRDRRYLRFSYRLTQLGVAAALLAFMLMASETVF